MKKIVLLVLLITFSLSCFAQSNNNQWSLSFGVNAINNLSSRNPFYKPGDWSFRNPISAAAEFSWIPNFAIEQSISVNAFTGNPEIDGIMPIKKYNYLSLDTHAKYYFKELIFGRGSYMSWFNIYANAGLGYFKIEESKLSANIGGGVLFWLNSNETIGLRAQAIGKFSFNNSVGSFYDNNHYQYHLQAIFKL